MPIQWWCGWVDHDDPEEKDTVVSTTTAAERLAAAKKRVEEAQKEEREASNALFQEMTQSLFATYPALESFGWRQFAPYFNDGDPCVFSAHTDADSILINGMEYDETYDYVIVPVPDADPTWPEWKKYKGEYVPHEEYKDIEPLFEVIANFLATFPDDWLEEKFGSDNSITVTADGVESESYGDHD